MTTQGFILKSLSATERRQKVADLLAMKDNEIMEITSKMTPEELEVLKFRTIEHYFLKSLDNKKMTPKRMSRTRMKLTNNDNSKSITSKKDKKTLLQSLFLLL